MSVYLVNVDVRVTDRKGNPVQGLEASHFTLREDGDRVEITHFLEVPPRKAGASASSAGAGEAEEPEGVPLTATPGTLVILLDDLGIRRQHRRLALEQVRRVLEGGLDPSVEVAVAYYDGQLRLVQQPTLDHAQALDGLRLLEQPSPRGQARLRERDSFLRQVLAEVGEVRNEVRADLIPAEEGIRRLNSLTAEVRNEVSRRRLENRDTYAALGALVDALASLPGRKALLYLSGGISISPGRAELEAIQDANFELSPMVGSSGASGGGIDARSAALGALDSQVPPRRPRRKAQQGKAAPPPDELGAVTALAARAGVSFYTWKGQGNLGGVAAEVGGEAAIGLTSNVLSTRESSLTGSLGYLADDTGGKSIVGGTVDALVENAVEGFGGYYSLGFSPEHGGDDRLHELKVKVKGRGLRVWYPKAYIARPSADPAEAGALTGESPAGGS